MKKRYRAYTEVMNLVEIEETPGMTKDEIVEAISKKFEDGNIISREEILEIGDIETEDGELLEEECREVMEKSSLASPKRMQELAWSIALHVGMDKTIHEQIDELYQMGFTRDELKSLMDYQEEDLDEYEKEMER